MYVYICVNIYIWQYNTDACFPALRIYRDAEPSRRLQGMLLYLSIYLYMYVCVYICVNIYIYMAV